MNDFMKKDITIKVVSVFSAIILWLFVLNTIENPFDTAKIIIPLSMQNESSLGEKGLGIKSGNNVTTVEVEVRGRKDQLSNLAVTDLAASVDFSKIDSSGRKDLNIELFSHRYGVEITNIRPKVLRLDVEKIIKKDLNVEVVTVGTPKDTYRITATSVSPQKITIEGLESLVEFAVSSKVIVNVEGLSRNIAIKSESKIYGENHQEIVGLSSSSEVEAIVEVARQVPVEAVVKGNPAADHIVTGKSVSPVAVLVSGLPEVIESIEALYTDTVNLDGISNTASYTTKIILPDGTRLVGAPNSAEVNIYIEKLVIGSFDIKKEDITLKNTDENLYNYRIENDIEIGLKGRQVDISMVNPDTFYPSADLAGLGEGTHAVPLKILVSDENLKLMQDYMIHVNISKKNEGI